MAIVKDYFMLIEFMNSNKIRWEQVKKWLENYKSGKITLILLWSKKYEEHAHMRVTVWEQSPQLDWGARQW